MRAFLLALCVLSAIGRPCDAQARRVAVTIDDLPTVSPMIQTEESRRRLTDSLLAALRRHDVPAIGFVNEVKLGPLGRPLPERKALLERWLAAGMELGNHTWSHPSLHQVTLAEYQREILMGDSTTKQLTGPVRTRYFRHPFLHAGRDSLVRDALARFLAKHHYVVAPVTIDNSDYLFAAAYDRRLAAGDTVTADSIARTYVRYMDTVFDYYEQQSQALLGRQVAQTLLLHANALNARSFDALAAMIRKRGYRFVSLTEALTDEAYRRPDGYWGPGGISWLHRWAFADGKRGAFFAGEPEVPEWINALSQP